MIDLHSHLLPGLDDGAANDSVALDMARAFVADGVEVVACTPHILPGLYLNSGPAIRAAVAQMQERLEQAGIPLRLIAGADNHIIPDFVAQLRSGHLLSLNDTRYVLVEPPHHVAPARMEELFFSILVAGYVPGPDTSGAVDLDPAQLSDDRAPCPIGRVHADHGRVADGTLRSRASLLGGTPSR